MLQERSSLAAVFVFLAAFFIFTTAPARAESFPAIPAAEEGGIEASTDLEFQLSSEPATKLILRQSFTFPFLAGSNPLTKDNNIKTVLAGEITPVSLSGMGEVIWTPVAFFLLSGGGRAGSGWNISLGNGIGINAPEDKNAPFDPTTDDPRKNKLYGDAFDGLIWSAWGAGTLQFDLGAVLPGDWNHVLFQTRQEFRYGSYTRAKAGEAWVFENDDMENQNGWKYYALYALGYQMPKSPVLSRIALIAELTKPLYNTPAGLYGSQGGDFWGESLGYWNFSSVFFLSFTPKLSSTLVFQMHTRRNHGTKNYDYSYVDYYYRDLELQKEGGQRRILFYRAAMIMNYKLR